MESSFTQLRFDISENVRLQSQQPGIDTLLELDLYPDIEIKDEGQHLKIQGYLRLNGSYLKQREGESEPDVHTNGEEDQQELAYVIPVEITLPRDRAEEDQISAEVEAFDYQVLSPFELKIDAILIIDGLLPERQAEIPGEVAPPDKEEALPVFSGQSAQPMASLAHQHDFDDAKVEIELETPDDPQKGDAEHEEQDVHLIQPVESIESMQANSEEQKALTVDPQDFWRERQASKQAQTAESIKEGEQPPEPVEMSDSADSERVDVEQEQTDGAQPDEKQENTSWIGWLLREKEEAFVPMKMVIVQKDDTIDTVANRYNVSANELIRLNRLQTDVLVEGQILNVPKQPEQPSSHAEISSFGWYGKKG
ncbi:LysM peptidoglycan-binding domain-containing protein [Laceyella sacchari]|uniref:LysM peptidoglycan-binding domain-containing protein n=1 Tax=Laceyella sacchari TaxID=37482 RepID=A0ABY5U4W5_LACSH|nr:LysM peptidoglycan-binding domain-containing protein [Laceyella sacchari]UWE04659.1 LysM peptidoglycan-binding domain-containing protein [Laceyella sacchari]